MERGGDNRSEAERFEVIYGRYSGDIAAYALRRATADDAADVVAETFVVAWRRLADVPPEPATLPWLFGVARRTLANQRRGRVRRGRLGQKLFTLLPEPVEVDHSDGVVSDEMAQVKAAMEKLAPDDRELIRLVAWEQLTPSDIAVVLGVSSATVRKRLHRARNRLRRKIGENHLGRPGSSGHELTREQISTQSPVEGRHKGTRSR